MNLRSGRMYTAPPPAPRRPVPRQGRKPRTTSANKPDPGSREEGSGFRRQSNDSQRSSSSKSSKGKGGKKGSNSGKSGNGSQRSSKSKSSKGKDKVRDGRISKQWRPDSKYNRPHGCPNVGNTCYRNAMLQCLLHIPVFCNYLLQMHREDVHVNGHCVVCSVQDLAHLYWLDRLHKGFPRSWMDDLHTAFERRIPETKHPFSDIRSVGPQADTMEFYAAVRQFFVEQEKPVDVSLADLTRVRWCERYTCPYCNRNTVDEMETEPLCISITTDDGKFNGQSLIENIRDFTSVERKQRCECMDMAEQLGQQPKTPTMKVSLTIKNAPDMLVVQLLRTYFNRRTKRAAKMRGEVAFDEELDLTDLTEEQEELRYRVHGVILHRGATVKTGHYVAAVRCPDSDVFSLVNDEYAGLPQSLAAMLDRQAMLGLEPYALLYQKLESGVDDESKAESRLDEDGKSKIDQEDAEAGIDA